VEPEQPFILLGKPLDLSVDPLGLLVNVGKFVPG
jgi:hypothetical protein